MRNFALELAATTLPDAPPSENIPAQIEMILKAVRLHLGMDVAFISEVSGGKRLFRHVDGDGLVPIRVGESDPLYNGYCGYVLDGSLPKLIPDTAKVALAMQIPATSQLPVGAHLSVPIRLSNGLVYGTFCCFSYMRDPSLNERDLSVMEAFAAIAAQLLESDLVAEQQRQKKIVSIETMIDQDQLSIVYQPIYRLKDISLAGFECLARFSALPSRPPNEWFSDAAEVGLGTRLEFAAIQTALTALSYLPTDMYLGVNASPANIASPGMAQLLVDFPVERIIVEITEHDLISDYSSLARLIHDASWVCLPLIGGQVAS
uniref:sensor domain-containing phosphodiesterase n=1 Tax=Mesorhizobium amorphae TaxID=71433 RepID=UPI00177C0589